MSQSAQNDDSRGSMTIAMTTMVLKMTTKMMMKIPKTPSNSPTNKQTTGAEGERYQEMAQSDRKEWKGNLLKGTPSLGKSSTKHQRGREDREEGGGKGKGENRENSGYKSELD